MGKRSGQTLHPNHVGMQGTRIVSIAHTANKYSSGRKHTKVSSLNVQCTGNYRFCELAAVHDAATQQQLVMSSHFVTYYERHLTAPRLVIQ